MEQKILFIFIDGLGLGSSEPTINLLADRERFPTLGRLLDESTPLDVSMGVTGTPQSATGQAALLTGLNASKLMGRHIEGFPPPRLKTLVQENNLFATLMAAGKTCTFANAYWLADVAHIPPRRESVTTVATLSAIGKVRGKEKLLANRAVYQDLTRAALLDRGYDGALVTPENAAVHLMDIASDHDFTLFEYFQTDHAGHSGDPNRVLHCLDHLERFFTVLQSFDGLLLMTSDHGNIEDLTVQTHTMYPVPLYTSQQKPFESVKRIEQVAPAVLTFFGAG
jgi:2,3-bisphosphoglycerate-independent phosphoglycerate mutase